MVGIMQKQKTKHSMIKRFILATTCAAVVAFSGFKKEPDRIPRPTVSLAQAQQVNKREIRRLIRRFGHKQWKVRDAASRQIVKIGKPAIPALIDAVKNSPGSIRGIAAVALARIGIDDNQFKKILNMFVKGKTRQEKEGALWALRHLKKDVRALPALVNAALNKKSSIGKGACEIVFSFFPFSQIIDGLKHKDKEIRKSAAKALETAYGNPRIIRCAHMTYQRLTPDMFPKKKRYALLYAPVFLVSSADKELKKIEEDKNEDPTIRTAAYDARQTIHKYIAAHAAPKVYLVPRP